MFIVRPCVFQRDARCEIFSGRARGEHDGSVAAGLHPVGDHLTLGFGRVRPERRVSHGHHLVRAEAAEPVHTLHAACTQDEGLDRAAQRVREPSRSGDDLLGHVPQGAVALLQYSEHGIHKTFASSRSSRR